MWGVCTTVEDVYKLQLTLIGSDQHLQYPIPRCPGCWSKMAKIGTLKSLKLFLLAKISPTTWDASHKKTKHPTKIPWHQKQPTITYHLPLGTFESMVFRTSPGGIWYVGSLEGKWLNTCWTIIFWKKSCQLKWCISVRAIPTHYHGTWKSALWKGDQFWNPLSGSMLNLRGVTCVSVYPRLILEVVLCCSMASWMVEPRDLWMHQRKPAKYTHSIHVWYIYLRVSIKINQM